MSARVRLLLLAGLALLGTAWIASVERAPIPSPAPVRSPVPAPETEPEIDLPSARAPVASSGREPLPTSDALRKRVKARRRPPPRKRSITGILDYPPGTPGDERVTVVGGGEAFPVARDGSFVASAPLRREISFDVRARYLYLSEPAILSATDPPELRLEPELGGVIRVRASGGPAGGSEAAPPASVLLDGPSSRTFELPLAAPVELGQLPPGRYELRAEHPHLAALFGSTVDVQAGAVHDVELAFVPGVTLRGHVRGEDGEPLPDATVSVGGLDGLAPATGRELALGVRRRRAAPPERASDETGAFELRGLPSGRVRLTASRRGLLPAEVELGPFAAGAVVEDVELVLSRGSSIAGRVWLPDGSTTSLGLEILLEDELDPTAAKIRVPGRHPSSAGSDSAGRFRAAGLARGPFRVTARLRPRPEEARRAPWIAVARGVPGGTENLRLVLGEPGRLEVRVPRDAVRDDLRVLAWGESGRTLAGSGSPPEPDILCRWAGLVPGRYTVWVRGPAGPVGSTAAWSVADVSAGRTTAVEPRLLPASALDVEVADALGHALAADVFVQSDGPLLRLPDDGLELSDGVYRVRAVLGRRAVEGRVLLAGEDVHLRLVLE